VAKSRFRRGDVSGDGRLDYSELAALLRRGDPTLRESEVRRLFEEIDSNDDGRIDFGEFCDYIFDQAELHAKPVPEYVKMAFHHFNGFNEKMSSSEFYRFCKESCLHNTSFRQSDAAIIFSKVKTKSQREINMLQFAHSLRLIAEKRGCDVEEVHQALAIYEDHEVHAEPSWSKHMDAFESAHKATVQKAHSRTLETCVEGKRTGKLLDVFLSRSPDDEKGNITASIMMNIIQDAGLIGRNLSRMEVKNLVDHALEKSSEVHRKGTLTFDHFSEVLFQISEKMDCHFSVVEEKVAALA